VNDVFLPFLGWLIGDIDLAALNIQLSPAVVQNGEVVKEAVVLGLGTFISAVLDFILIAFIVFSIVKALNAAKRKLEKPAEPAAPAAPEPSNEEKLLTEIRDLLKNQK
jgi:large conductance mechanosensitive channel